MERSGRGVGPGTDGERIGLLVPTDRAGVVVGKAGAGLRQVREATGCTVTLEQHPDQHGLRRADLHGASVDQLAAAFQQLASKVLQTPTTEQPGMLTILVPAEKAGTVIGKGGENLKRIRESTRVQLAMERDPVVDPRSGAQERVVSLQGEARQMGAALRIALGGGPLYRPSAAAAVGRSWSGSSSAAGRSWPETSAMPVQRPWPGAAAASREAALTQVRPVSAEAGDVQLHLVIPDSAAGAILGKDGAQVKQTAAMTGCKTVAVTRRDGSSDRRVVIIGGFNQCLAAQKLVYQTYAEAAQVGGQDMSQVTVIFLIPKVAAGAVIGKEASTLRSIREASGVKLSLARDEVEEQRPCTITGPIQSVLQAEKLIYAQVTAAEPPASAGPGPGTGTVIGAVSTVGAVGPSGIIGVVGAVGSTVIGKKRTPEAAFVHAGPSPAPSGTPKRQRMDSTGADATKLLVPARSAGAVIGKQGSGLKQLRETYGVHVELLQQVQAPQWPNDRVVILTGPAPARQAALESLLRTAFQMDEQNTVLKLLLPSAAVGGIIGKQGSTLRSIRETCGASVKVEREEVLGERLVSSQGPLHTVLAGAAAVLSILEGAASPGPAWDAGMVEPAPGPPAVEMPVEEWGEPEPAAWPTAGY